VGGGIISVLYILHNAHANLVHVHVALSIDFHDIILHAPISICSIVVHMNSQFSIMDVNGNGIDSTKSLGYFGYQKPPQCPHEVNMPNTFDDFDVPSNTI
jgi:hypothetical protein